MASTKKSALATNAIVDLTALSTEVFVNYKEVEVQASSNKPQAASVKHQASQASSQHRKVSRQ